MLRILLLGYTIERAGGLDRLMDVVARAGTSLTSWHLKTGEMRD